MSMGKFSFIKSLLGLAWARAQGKDAYLDKLVRISCCMCADEALAKQRLRVGKKGIWLSDPVAQAPWGVRYERQLDGPPVPEFYCGLCSQDPKRGRGRGNHASECC
jgi:hypothetical protein